MSRKAGLEQMRGIGRLATTQVGAMGQRKWRERQSAFTKCFDALAKTNMNETEGNKKKGGHMAPARCLSGRCLSRCYGAHHDGIDAGAVAGVAEADGLGFIDHLLRIEIIGGLNVV